MRSQYLIALALAAAATVGACDHSSPTDGTRTATAKVTSGSDTSTNGPGNGGGAGGTSTGTPTDTGSTYHGTVNLTVSVVTYTHAQVASGDTLAVTGVANALVEASAITASGVGPAQQLGRTDAHGLLAAGTMAAGPYIIRATPPNGSASQVSVVLDQPTATVRVGVAPQQ